jgi:hypothetical protein
MGTRDGSETFGELIEQPSQDNKKRHPQVAFFYVVKKLKPPSSPSSRDQEFRSL